MTSLGRLIRDTAPAYAGHHGCGSAPCKFEASPE
eukprot:CAMPEP_0185772312 /NCGR_PEP_ID=MMETSP1174-20130828/68293_1 /TAXON_ID=35687 /ORGANISM="Dictyocha speculum, Strain CCMP1381" /LENGTH=33 /DNA_ID= /DNA_START= /DNA_END= /DNA_ORIENTATION=